MPESRCWLIAYYCVNHTSHYNECLWKGTLGQWRIAHMKYEDGPYILLAAHPISLDEYMQLEGRIG